MPQCLNGSKWAFCVILSNRLSLWKIRRRKGREMTDNEISLGSTKAALLCSNFIRCSTTTEHLQETRGVSTLMLSHAVSTVAYNYSYIRESTHIISKNKTPKNRGEEYLIQRQYENASISSDIQPQLQWISSTNRKDDDWANTGEMRLSFVPRKFGTILNSAEEHCPEVPGCCCCIEAVNIM